MWYACSRYIYMLHVHVAASLEQSEVVFKIVVLQTYTVVRSIQISEVYTYIQRTLTLGTYLGCPEYPGILSIQGSEVSHTRGILGMSRVSRDTKYSGI